MIYNEVVVHVTGDETVSLVKVMIGLLSCDPPSRAITPDLPTGGTSHTTNYSTLVYQAKWSKLYSSLVQCDIVPWSIVYYTSVW